MPKHQISWNKDKHLSIKHRLRISQANQGRVGLQRGKHLSLTHREYISNALTGRKLTVKYRKNVSEAIKRWWSIAANKERMRTIQTGTHTPRQHKNISE